MKPSMSARLSNRTLEAEASITSLKARVHELEWSAKQSTDED
jgi:hypothetical protein